MDTPKKPQQQSIMIIRNQQYICSVKNKRQLENVNIIQVYKNQSTRIKTNRHM